MPTIPELEEKFLKKIKKYGILEYHLGDYVITGTNRILMGLHMDMYYPTDVCLSSGDISILKYLVRTYYAPVVEIKHTPKDTHTLGWKSGDDPNRTVRVITFIFQTGEQYRQAHPNGI